MFKYASWFERIRGYSGRLNPILLLTIVKVPPCEPSRASFHSHAYSPDNLDYMVWGA
jgi:hypothetical protein